LRKQIKRSSRVGPAAVRLVSVAAALLLFGPLAAAASEPLSSPVSPNVEWRDSVLYFVLTALWINPIVKNIDGFVTGAGFPDWAYHGYWADDFLAMDRRFGTEAQLKSLVEACHRRGIRVLLDVVYNHAEYGSRYLTDPKTTARRRRGPAARTTSRRAWPACRTSRLSCPRSPVS
jgi:hypothetical protein